MPRKPNRRDLTERNLPPLKRLASDVIALKKQFKRIEATVLAIDRRLGK